MADTLSTIRDLVYLRADVSSEDPKFTSTKVDQFINAALRQVSTDFNPYWLQTSASLSVVVNTTSYALTGFTRFSKLQRVVDDEGFDLIAVSKREIDRYIRQRSKPQVYVVEGGYLKIGPTPEAAYTYTVHFYQTEAGLSSDSDQPALPSQYTDYLVVAAARMVAMKNKDTETVNYMAQEMRDWKARIDDDMRQMTANPRIVVRDEGL